MSQYIGKTISLISNKGLRYVGLLDNINAENATLGLKSVRTFGTEGRNAQSGNSMIEVLPTSEIYDYIVFRGSDVKDLTVLDVPIEQVKPQTYVLSAQPKGYYQTPIMTQMMSVGHGSDVQGPTQILGQGVNYPDELRCLETNVENSENVNEIKTEKLNDTHLSSHVDSDKMSFKLPIPEMINSKSKKNETGKHKNQKYKKSNFSAGPVKRKEINIPKTEFDFSSSNERFNKDALITNNSETPSYNKNKSFFDNISSSTDEVSVMKWSEERSLNLDTFGEASVNHRGRNRGNWRGRINNNRRNNRGRGRGS